MIASVGASRQAPAAPLGGTVGRFAGSVGRVDDETPAHAPRDTARAEARARPAAARAKVDRIGCMVTPWALPPPCPESHCGPLTHRAPPARKRLARSGTPHEKPRAV